MTTTTKLAAFIEKNGSDFAKLSPELQKEFLKLGNEKEKVAHIKRGTPTPEDAAKYSAICKELEIEESPMFSGFVYQEKFGPKPPKKNPEAVTGEVAKAKLTQVVVGVKYVKEGRVGYIQSLVKPSEVVPGSTVVEDVYNESVIILSKI